MGQHIFQGGDGATLTCGELGCYTTTLNCIVAHNLQQNSNKENLKKKSYNAEYNTQTTKELEFRPVLRPSSGMSIQKPYKGR
jgi:hypothetical protein